MSERIRPQHEASSEKHEQRDQTHEKRLQAHHETRAAKAHHEHRERIDHILETIEKQATPAGEIRDKQETKPDLPSAQFMSSGIRDQALKQNLNKVRRSLSTPEKQLSKIIHNDVVDKISEASSQTVARPSGLLFGGVAAFLTNLAILLICRYYGYEYNYFLGVAGFVGGFGAGLLIELLYKQLRHR